MKIFKVDVYIIYTQKGMSNIKMRTCQALGPAYTPITVTTRLLSHGSMNAAGDFNARGQLTSRARNVCATALDPLADIRMTVPLLGPRCWSQPCTACHHLEHAAARWGGEFIWIENSHFKLYLQILEKISKERFLP